MVFTIVAGKRQVTGEPCPPEKRVAGVPLGVDTPTWNSPGIWPTKTEMSGEDDVDDDLPEPTPVANDQSAVDFEETLKATFSEERSLGTVEGPSQRKRPRRSADAQSHNCARANWEQSKRQTRRGQSTKAQWVDKTPKSRRTPGNAQPCPLQRIACKPSICAGRIPHSCPVGTGHLPPRRTPGYF